jgi:hypothetical protein
MKKNWFVFKFQEISFCHAIREVVRTYFIGRINFLRRFIPFFFPEIIKLITDMLKKDNEVKWTTKANESFQ